MSDTRLRIAVFIDFDNIEIGVKNTLSTQFDAGLVLEALRERGDVVSKTAYSDWQRAGDYSRLLTQHAIKMVQRNLTPGGDKNGADINLALDALEMALTHSHINAFVIVGGDSDFISLVEKLKQYDKKVFVVGGRQFTSHIMQRNCHEFIAYENLLSSSRKQQGGGRGQTKSQERGLAIEQAVPLVRRAMKVLTEREVSPQLGLLKSTLLQLDSTFSERDYGAGSFRDFVEKLQKIGVVVLKHEGRNLLVEESENPPEIVVPAQPLTQPVAAEAERPAPAAAAASSAQAAPPDPARATEGVNEVRRILQAIEAKKSIRWPLYIRQMKQLLKVNGSGFDERTYGFVTLVDLLRAAQKANMLRLDRDRQGAIRVFQGQSLSLPSSTEAMAAEPMGSAVEGDTAVEEAVASELLDVTPAVTLDVAAEGADGELATAPVDVETKGRRRKSAASRKPGVERRRAARVPKEKAADAKGRTANERSGASGSPRASEPGGVQGAPPRVKERRRAPRKKKVEETV